MTTSETRARLSNRVDEVEHIPVTRHAQVFGHSISLNFTPRYTLPAATSEPALAIHHQTFTLSTTPALPLYRSQNLLEDGSPVLTINRHTEGDRLDFAHLTHFLVDDKQILVHPRNHASPDLVSSRLFGPVMAYWLESQSTTVLHASAVATEIGAIAFLSHNGGGKSTLAAAMMRCGSRLLADDMLAVTTRSTAVQALPAYPEMRMWPDVARFFIDDLQSFTTVHPESPKLRIPVGAGTFGEFCQTPTLLRAMYLPYRVPGCATPAIETLPRSEAARLLIRHSFVPQLAAVARDPGERLDAIVQLANTLPVMRIRVGGGPTCLDAVCECLSEDLAAVDH
jgi:hypothetical protein